MAGTNHVETSRNFIRKWGGPKPKMTGGTRRPAQLVACGGGLGCPSSRANFYGRAVRNDAPDFFDFFIRDGDASQSPIAHDMSYSYVTPAIR
jgi:hypothetical protein